LTTAKQGQSQPSNKQQNKINNIIRSTNDLRDQEITLKEKATQSKCAI
jgi:hypothetical protein